MGEREGSSESQLSPGSLVGQPLETHAVPMRLKQHAEQEHWHLLMLSADHNCG